MSYLPNLFTTGAIRETPQKVIRKIVGEVTFTADTTTIIEIGAGRGEITKPLLHKAKGKQNLSYYAFEIDEEACQYLRKHLHALTVVNGSAFEFEKHIPPAAKVDYFISSIPLSFYKKEMIGPFLQKIKTWLKPDGKLIIIFSAAWLMPLFKKHLPQLKPYTFLSFPPYFMVVYKHKV
ncbi:class I SAM-dependent methyltransferase [Pontibacter ruber]|uniref:L-histidine N(Alpha)-methyltransferase n=1 Tax=Pontibacter ruber TaxID=1343895 RepID=A0ABW5D1F9_9BACT|nr:class I SAM-dependent methyltransferase [Pontibacter ruber]